MNYKDRETFEALIKDEMPSYNFSFRTYAKEHRKLDEMYMNPALHNLWLTWQAALAYARKEQRELLEKIATVLKAVPEREYPCEGEDSNCHGCKHVRDAEEVLAEINATGIGEKARESGIPKTPKQSGLVDCKFNEEFYL